VRAAAQIADQRDVIVLGSQAVLGSFHEDQLPDEAIGSMEADIAFFKDDDNAQADAVTGAIGELSRFHDSFGVYADGVTISTAVKPVGWHERLVILETPATAPGRGLCLERHDLAASKLVAHRPKDLAFVGALLREGLVDASVLRSRIEELPVDGTVRQRLIEWLHSVS